MDLEKQSTSLGNLVLDGAHRTISSAKSPPQHLDSPKGIPSSETSLKMSLIKRLKRIGDSGQPCLTPFIILKDSEYWSSILTLALTSNFNPI